MNRASRSATANARSWLGFCLRCAVALAVGSCASDADPRDAGVADAAVAVTVAALTVDIHNWTELQAMENNLHGDYRLANDIDCTTFDYGDGKGFKRVGYGGSTFNPFTGTF